MVQRYTYTGGYPKAIESRYQSDPRLALALGGVQAGSSMAPVQSPLEGIARALQGVVGGYTQNRIKKDYDQQADEYTKRVAAALQGDRTGLAERLTAIDPDMGLQLALSEAQAKPDEMWTDLTDEQEAAAGLETSGAYQRSTSGQIKEVAAPKKTEQPKLVQVVKNGVPTWVSETEAAGLQAGFAPKPDQPPAPTDWDKKWALLQRQYPNGVPEDVLLRFADAAPPDTKAPTGYQWTGDGKLVPISGGPSDPATVSTIREAASGAKPATDAQAMSAGYFDRATEAAGIIDGLEQAGWTPDYMGNALAAMPFGNKWVSENRQKFEQAQRNFVNAVLRKESGAVINEEEFENARRQYFAQPGDGPEVLAQKKRNREAAINSLKIAAGPVIERNDSVQPSIPTYDPTTGQWTGL